MKIYKTKIGKLINFIKNEGKFERSDIVRVNKNTSKYKVYDKYVGQIAIVTNIDYDKKDYVVGLKFLDGKNIDFKPSEIEILDFYDLHGENYKDARKLLNMI